MIRSLLRVVLVSAVSVIGTAAVAQDDAVATAFSKEISKELEECAQYNFLLAAYYLTQVQQSQPLSPSDENNFIKANAYRYKAKQIEVLMQEFEPASGMTDSELKARANAMFERLKGLMGPRWDIDKLHARYGGFCHLILSKEGWKARTDELLQGKVCEGLYKCW